MADLGDSLYFESLDLILHENLGSVTFFGKPRQKHYMLTSSRYVEVIKPIRSTVTTSFVKRNNRDLENHTLRSQQHL